MQPAFKQQIVALLDAHRIMTIATKRPDGWPQATIVGYVNDGIMIYCIVGRASQKFANIMRDPRVSIAIAHDYPQPLQIKGLSLAARAALAEERSEIDLALQLLLRRYPEYKQLPRPDFGNLAMLRIRPEIVSILDYSKGFGHTDLVRVTDSDLTEHLETRQHKWSAFDFVTALK